MIQINAAARVMRGITSCFSLVTFDFSLVHFLHLDPYYHPQQSHIRWIRTIKAGMNGKLASLIDGRLDPFSKYKVGVGDQYLATTVHCARAAL
jgi:hypothetical protein